MWRSREKSSPKINKSLSKNFSFKDIESLSDDSTSDGHRHNPPPSYKSSISSLTPAVFHRVLRATAVLRALSAPPRPPDPSHSSRPPQPDPTISIPNAENRIIVYLTTLRIVRTTFEACKTVQSILTGFRVTVDERDLSMDSSFKDELEKILRVGEKTQLTLPRVFVGGKYIGGAEELRQLNETGELKKMIAELPEADIGVCEECGGHQFVVCNECSGSHKCYTEKTNGFRSCTVCNENGLIRCSSCSYGPISIT